MIALFTSVAAMGATPDGSTTIQPHTVTIPTGTATPTAPPTVTPSPTITGTATPTPTPACTTLTFAGTGVGDIPDGLSGEPPQFGPPLAISFAVSGLTGPLASVSVDVTLTHSFVGEVEMVLTSPVGTSHVMVSRIGANEAIGPGDSSNYAGTYNFTDSTFGPSIWNVAMATACGDTCNVTPGDYRTTKSGLPGATDFTLSFLGLNTTQVNGTWTLTIRDAAAGETGTVTAANLKLRRNCGTPTPVPTPTSGPTLTPTPTPIPGALLDTITGASTTTFTNSLPRTYMGDGWTNNTIPAGSTSVKITSLRLYLVSATTQAYTDVVARIQFWNTHNQSATPVFSNPSGPLITADLGPRNFTANSPVTLPITLATPVTLPGGPGTNWGFTVNYQGNTGAGLVDTDNLTSVISAYPAGPTDGYYRNKSGRVDFNFDATDSRALIGLNAQGIAIVILGTAQPTPTLTPTPTPTPPASPSVSPSPTVGETSTPSPFTPTPTPNPTPTPTPIPGTLLDTITGADTTTFTGSTPRTYMGDSWTNNTIPAGSTSVRITALTLYMVSATTQAYSDVVARIQFWNSFNAAANPVFTDASGPLITADLGPLNLTANSFTAIPVTLATPLTLPGGPGTNWGFVVNFQGNTGAGLADTTNLTAMITAHSNGRYSTGQITTGNAPAFGYYRNASNRVDFNFNSSDARTLAGLNAQGIGIIIFGTAEGGETPTPTPPPSPTVSVSPSATATATTLPTATPKPTQTPLPTATATPASEEPTKAINLSTRMRVQVGDGAGIGGFIITGSAARHVVVRAIGPSLNQFGVVDALADPVLEIHGPSGFTTLVNDNWRDSQSPVTVLAPTNNLESAMEFFLEPGAYTAVVKGKNNATGVALVEVYDLSQTDGKLGNISTRAFVSTGDNIVIAGMVLSQGSGSDRLVFRGIGPSLAPAFFPASAVLANPTLELRGQDGTLILANDNWQDNAAQAAEITAAGLAPGNNMEAAIAISLPSGFYTVLLAGTNNGTGIGVVEIYDRGP